MRTRFAPLLAALTAIGSSLVATVPAPADAAPSRRIAVTTWDSATQLGQGSAKGVEIRDGQLRLVTPGWTSRSTEYSRWISPWVTPGFDLTELIASWEARTPGASWVRIQVQGRTEAGTRSSWDTLAHWARQDTKVRRTSLGAQTDDLGRVAYDTWLTSGVAAWRLRVTLGRPIGARAEPTVDAVRAMASRLPSATSVSTSTPGGAPAALGTVLPVPSYSQMVHEGEYPEYDGGGEAWCSPTSLTMVLDYYDALPPKSAYRWVRTDYPDRVVPHIARMTYDVGFGGTGNWPFNTAFAASRTGDAFVTRLRDLREAERFIAAGIPLVASISFSSGQLTGAPISATNGHLLVIAGFTADGDVVVNDPAASTRGGVRRTYDRGQFESAWLKRYASGSSMKGSGGLVYVVRDAAHPLPARSGNRNW